MHQHPASYHSFWGKTRRRDDGSDGWHSIAYHSLDVAAVGSVLLRDNGLPRVVAALHPLLLTLLAWHDIGKFTRPFQCKVETLWPPVLSPFRPTSVSYGHDTAGYGLLINPPLSEMTTSLDCWARVPRRRGNEPSLQQPLERVIGRSPQARE
jgi:CRISPR-associated endonuclease/helicase Cas3